jgi:hypothetical protein
MKRMVGCECGRLMKGYLPRLRGFFMALLSLNDNQAISSKAVTAVVNISCVSANTSAIGRSGAGSDEPAVRRKPEQRRPL